MIITARTKPREVKAVQWDGTEETFRSAVAPLLGCEVEPLGSHGSATMASNKIFYLKHPDEQEFAGYRRGTFRKPSGELTLRTVDNNSVKVPHGGWVMVDETEHGYPCDADVFEQRYEVIS